MEVDPPTTPADEKWVPEIDDKDIEALNALTKSGIYTWWEIIREDHVPPYVLVKHSLGGWLHFVPVPEERRWHCVARFAKCLMRGPSVAALCRKRLMKMTQTAAEQTGMVVEVVNRGTVQKRQQSFLVLRHPGPKSARRTAS